MTRKPPMFGVALSGGGARAVLATLGALMALVDRGLNVRVEHIASVSGGSITNAFIAQRCDYSTIDPAEMDAMARSLVQRVVKGTLTKPWVAAIISVPLLVGAALCAALWAVSGAWFVSVPIGFAAMVVGLTAAGKVVEYLLNRRFLRDGTLNEVRPTMADIVGGTVEHVFCATDLVRGAPVYVSSWDGGVLWRRASTRQTSVGTLVHGERWDAARLTIAEVVRASAAFPGIPPRRISFGQRGKLRYLADRPPTFGGAVPTPEDWRDAPKAARGTAFLADGGLWNNLASQALREDRIVRGRSSDDSPRILLCVNGSSVLSPGPAWPYRTPGFGLAMSLFRGTKILNANTVQPRASSMRDETYYRILHEPHSIAGRPLDLVVELSDRVSSVEAYLRQLGRNRDQIRLASRPHHQWELKTARLVREWRNRVIWRHRGEHSNVLRRRKLDEILDQHERDDLVDELVDHVENEPLLDLLGPGLLDHNWFDRITHTRAWSEAQELADGAVDVPTTLGPIPAEQAIRLVARGYLNTYLTSLIIEGEWGMNLTDPLQNLPGRLRQLMVEENK